MSTTRMFDSVNISMIPKDAPAVAGYVNGRFRTWQALGQHFPNAHRLSIAVSSDADAECLDVEPGDATNGVAAGWLERQLRRGVKRPVVYTSLSNAQALVDVLAAAGHKRSSYRLWTAHYTHLPHICSRACGLGFEGRADATQWTDKALGRNLDESRCGSSFFGDPPKPKPKPDGPVQFTRDEAHTLRLLINERKRGTKGNSALAKKRRSNIRKYKRTLLIYLVKLRAAGRTSGWDKQDRRRRYAAIEKVYNGGTVKL